MVPQEVHLKEAFLQKERKVKRNAAFSTWLMDKSVTAFRISMVDIGTIFMILEIFKESILDLMLEAVDILSRF